MPKPILPALGTITCPLCDSPAQVKQDKRRQFFGYCSRCGKFGERGDYVQQHMQLADGSTPAPVPAPTKPATPPPSEPEKINTDIAPPPPPAVMGAIPWL